MAAKGPAITRPTVAVALAVALGASTVASAQATDDQSKTVLQDTPWSSPRAAAMGGALAPLADYLDAPYYNPAGIGGIDTDAKKTPLVRGLYFPMVGGAVNESALALNQRFNQEGARGDAQVASAVLDAQAGERQYGRTSLLPSVMIGNSFLGYLYDEQLAAVAQGSDGLVAVHRRVDMGPVAGFSVGATDGSLYLGAFSTLLDRSEVKGQFRYGDIDDRTSRQSVLNANATQYEALATNVGLLWRIAKTATPSLAVVARNLGGTRYKTSQAGRDDLTILEDLTVAFSVSPKLGNWGFFNFALEASDLHDHEIAVRKKIKAGLELTFGRTAGSRASLALRLGGNHAGLSYGVGANLGLIGLQYASFAEDVGIANERVIERRREALITVNVAAN